VTAQTSAGEARPALIYLVRHGQTPLNEAGVLRGLLDPSLDEVGRQQARRLGAALGPRHPVLVISSPLRRARQTAQPVADRAGLEVGIDPCLIDRDYGPWTGMSKESVVARWGSVDDAPGVESRSSVRQRALPSLTGLAQHSRGAAIVVVSHDAVNRELLAALDPGLGAPDSIPQDNGCFNTLELNGAEWAVRGINQLPAEPRPGHPAGPP
jgi:broad specificity phosphatase PhoE